jgi:hypothetical protein
MQSSEVRFYRSSLSHYARVTEYRDGEGSGLDCGGTFVVPQSHYADPFDVCFGCNGNGPHWSRDYVTTLDLPYVRHAEQSFEYSRVKYRVYLASTGSRAYYSGTECSGVVFWGASGC